jgi:hypothetical protein
MYVCVSVVPCRWKHVRKNFREEEKRAIYASRY